MYYIFLLLSLFAFPVFILLILIKVIFKKGPTIKKSSILAATSFVILIASGILMPDLTAEEREQIEHEKQIKLEKSEAKQLEKKEKEEKKEEIKQIKEKKKADEKAEEDKLAKDKKRKKEKEQELQKKKKEQNAIKADKQKENKKKEKEKLKAEKKKKKAEAKTKKEKQKEQNKLEKAEAKKKKEKKIKKENAKKPTETKKKESKPKKEKKKEKKKLTIDKKMVKSNSNVDKAKFIDTGVLRVHINPSSVWSENSFVTTYTYYALEAINEAFKDKGVNEVEVQINTDFTDAKGNESKDQAVTITYDRAKFEELNYKKFKTMASGQEWRILNESSTYNIHPGIFIEIKDKYRQNLINGMSKSNTPGF